MSYTTAKAAISDALGNNYSAIDLCHTAFVCEGISQQYYDAKYDVHKDITEIWTVGWSSCQYDLWSGF